jgi:DNA (cytosine-5)-methyltransferase 1
VSPRSTSPLTFTVLIGMLRFIFDKKDASFTDPPPPNDSYAAADPPHNCAICARREEEETQARGRIVRKAGVVSGVAIHGATFHVGDFALVRAEQGPSHIAQFIGMYSGDPVWVKMQLLGRVSDLADLLPPDELRDEVCFSHVLCPETNFFFPFF